MRDYVRNSSPSKRKPAPNKNGRRPVKGGNQGSPFPIMRAALAAVLVVGFGFFLYHISGSSEQPAAGTTEQTQAKNIPIEQQRPAKEQFDYMQLLQNKEVPVTLPDGEIVADPSKDPQLLAHQLKMQEQLQAQAARAKQLAAQQNGQLPDTGDDDDSDQPTTLNAAATNALNNPAKIPTPKNTIAGETARSTTTPEDVRKPRSFADVIATETGKKKTTSAATATTTTTQTQNTAQPVNRAEKERDDALAMFGKPRSYADEIGAVKKSSSTPTSTTAATTTSTSAATTSRFMMQCGAFRTPDQANTLKSRVAVQGQSAQIHQIVTTTGTWNRVVLGPYANRAAADQALSRLKASGAVSSCTIFGK